MLSTLSTASSPLIVNQNNTMNKQGDNINRSKRNETITKVNRESIEKLNTSLMAIWSAEDILNVKIYKLSLEFMEFEMGKKSKDGFDLIKDYLNYYFLQFLLFHSNKYNGDTFSYDENRPFYLTDQDFHYTMKLFRHKEIQCVHPDSHIFNFFYHAHANNSEQTLFILELRKWYMNWNTTFFNVKRNEFELDFFFEYVVQTLLSHLATLIMSLGEKVDNLLEYVEYLSKKIMYVFSEKYISKWLLSNLSFFDFYQMSLKHADKNDDEDSDEDLFTPNYTMISRFVDVSMFSKEFNALNVNGMDGILEKIKMFLKQICVDYSIYYVILPASVDKYDTFMEERKALSKEIDHVFGTKNEWDAHHVIHCLNNLYVFLLDYSLARDSVMSGSHYLSQYFFSILKDLNINMLSSQMPTRVMGMENDDSMVQYRLPFLFDENILSMSKDCVFLNKFIL